MPRVRVGRASSHRIESSTNQLERRYIPSNAKAIRQPCFSSNCCFCVIVRIENAVNSIKASLMEYLGLEQVAFLQMLWQPPGMPDLSRNWNDLQWMRDAHHPKARYGRSADASPLPMEVFLSFAVSADCDCDTE